jgi:hypothetical protein
VRIGQIPPILFCKTWLVTELLRNPQFSTTTHLAMVYPLGKSFFLKIHILSIIIDIQHINTINAGSNNGIKKAPDQTLVIKLLHLNKNK